MQGGHYGPFLSISSPPTDGCPSAKSNYASASASAWQTGSREAKIDQRSGERIVDRYFAASAMLTSMVVFHHSTEVE